MTIGFDLISDLNLTSENGFSWENKATSLYCLIAGNISNDLSVVAKVISHLSNFYQGVFYTPGSLEYEGVEDYDSRTKEIIRICQRIRNVAVLHQHVVQ